MSERQQASVAEQQIEAERGDSRDQAVGQKLCLINADKGGQQDQHDQHGGRRRGQPYFRAILQPTHHHALPYSPVGLIISTAAAIR